MNGAESIITILEQQGIKTIFGYPGGCIMPLYDALLGSSITHVLCRHEQGAALAADGYARASGDLGVCVATSGPGATNLITGVANAYMDSIPLLVITGQVPTELIGTDAFQEADVLGMTLGIVKHSYLVTDAKELPFILIEALKMAASGRPGPVWIDVPKNVLMQTCELTTLADSTCDSTGEPATDADVAFDQALGMIRSASKPLIYSGGGIAAANAVEAFRVFVNGLQVPQVVTLKGIGNPGTESPWNLGMLGMHGSRAANEAVEQCDLLIAVGVRFDDRATGKANTFAPNAKVIHFDIDGSEFHKNRMVDCVLAGEFNSIFATLNQKIIKPLEIDPWRETCERLQKTKGFKPFSLDKAADVITGPGFLTRLNNFLGDCSIVACDVGQHQMWVAQYMAFNHPREHLSSSGLGTMGFGLPAAIGASFARPDAVVINLSGDGSFMMNVQELATIKRFNLPVKIIILNNQKLGMVRQQQELFYAERYSEVDLSDNPDFVVLAKSFDIPAARISHPTEVDSAISRLTMAPGAFLLEVVIESNTNVWPVVKPGSANHQVLDEPHVLHS